MSNDNYPIPPSHKTFSFGSVVIDSNFDSGNCSEVEKISSNQFNIWIGVDHQKNKYRTWFHFSAAGFSKGNTVTFTIKNMQNQSRLINEGLVPVYREQSSQQWKRIKDRINTSAMEYSEGCLQWSFKHTMQSNEKVFFAFFYPWSNDDNNKFLSQIQQKVKSIPNIYFYRSAIIKSIQGRPIQFLVISSKKYKTNAQQKIEDENLFNNSKKPFMFGPQKKGVVISARVHPGQVPGSHVMTGILKQLTQPEGVGKLLRDQFVFYIFPILNPDGVGRGHFRVDTNGINLNRCYLSPSPKHHCSIYAIRKMILHLHKEHKFFAYLDLHAHAAKKGTFIYGNYINQLLRQVDTCIFPKILSLNSEDFEYEGSNFTQKNMYCKDKGDHMSKQGSGRVGMYKMTKNPYCWTLECNYNISKTNNILQPRKQEGEEKPITNVNQLNEQLILEYRQQPKREAKQFFTMQTYHKLGKQICQSFLDLIQKNPHSRIDNQNNHFKSVENLRMNLTVALLKMAPNRFEQNFKKIYYALTTSQNPQSVGFALKALYLLGIKKAKIPNVKNFLKDGNMKDIDIPITKKPFTTGNVKKNRYNSLMDKKTLFVINKAESSRQIKVKISEHIVQKKQILENEKSVLPNNDVNDDVNNEDNDNYSQMSGQSIEEVEQKPQKVFHITRDTRQREQKDYKITEERKKDNGRISVKLQQFRMIGISNGRKLLSKDPKQTIKGNQLSKVAMMSETKTNKYRVNELPSLGSLKFKHPLIKGVKVDPQLYRKGNSSKEAIIQYV